MNARLRADGWIGGDRLPVQRRVSLGGPDLLPGYGFRAFTCAPRGLRRSVGARALRPLHHRPGRGPDAARASTSAIGCATARASAGRFIGIEEADLVLLGDAGKAWLAGDGPGQVPVNRIPSFHEWKTDVGVGLDAGQIGAYLAKSLSEGEPVRFIVRLQRRF